MLFTEVQRYKEGMKDICYQQKLGATVACKKRMMEGKKGIGQNYKKEWPKDCFLFDSWFASKKASEAATEIGAELIGMVKTNTKGLCKEKI